ncbi:MAG: T9SS type A sorting domain-containing protein [Flavobacteriales bacterium]
MLAIDATHCDFQRCGLGIYAQQLSQTSHLDGCRGEYNNCPADLRGPGSVWITDPAFDQNWIGLFLTQVDTRVACGRISRNGAIGIAVSNGATLRMDGSGGVPHQPVSVVDNPTSIFCNQANNVYLNNGRNALWPAVPGIQKTLIGTFLCQPYAANQPAHSNNWNGTVGVPLTSAEYDITSCGGHLNFLDSLSVSEVLCGQAIPPCPNPPCEWTGEPPPLGNCNTCRYVDTEEYGRQKLNVASSRARDMAEANTEADNEVQALDGYHQLLTLALPVPSPDEQSLMQYNYERMKESYSDALAKGQLAVEDAATMDRYVAKLAEVQDRKIAEAQEAGYTELAFYLALDKAQVHHAGGKLDEAIEQFAALAGSSVDQEGLDLVAQLECLARAERDIRDGVVRAYDVDLATLDCHGQAYRKSLMTTSTADVAAGNIRFVPNPSTGVFTLEGVPAGYTLEVLDVLGREARGANTNGRNTVDLSFLPNGLYTCRLSWADGSSHTARVVVRH